MNSGKHTRLFVTTAGLCLMFGLAACGSMPPQAVVAPTAVPDATASDATLGALVKQRIEESAPEAAVVVRAEQGRVELSGTVPDAEVARKAVKEALSTEGVRGVVNEMAVDQQSGDEQAAEVPLIAAH